MAAVFTIGSNVFGGGGTPGGAAGGALTGTYPSPLLANLTTVGAVPYVSVAGVLSQDQTAGGQFFWDATNHRLGVGTASPGTRVDVGGTIRVTDSTPPASGAGLELEYAGGIGKFFAFNRTGSAYLPMELDGVSLKLKVSGTQGLYLAPTTRNILIGTGTTDGNFKLDIQASGSSGTFRAYDQTAVTGSTLAVVRAGAGQSGNLMTFQNNGGTAISFVGASGGFAAQSYDVYNQTALSSRGFSLYGDGTKSIIDSSSDALIRWYSATNLGGSADTGLARNAAGILEVNNGTAGTYRDLRARRTQTGTVAVSALPAASAALAGSIQAVSDALAPAWGVTVAAGGAAYALVTCNGAAWTVIGV